MWSSGIEYFTANLLFQFFFKVNNAFARMNRYLLIEVCKAILLLRIPASRRGVKILQVIVNLYTVYQRCTDTMFNPLQLPLALISTRKTFTYSRTRHPLFAGLKNQDVSKTPTTKFCPEDAYS